MGYSRSWFIVMGLVFIGAAIFELLTPLGADSLFTRTWLIIISIILALALLLTVLLASLYPEGRLTKLLRGDPNRPAKLSARSLYLRAALPGLAAAFYLVITIGQMRDYGLRLPGANILEALIFLLLTANLILAARQASRQGLTNTTLSRYDKFVIVVIPIEAVVLLGLSAFLFVSSVSAGDAVAQKFIPTGLAFTPDGRTVIAGGAGTIRQWDVTSAQPIGQPFGGYSKDTQGIALMPDGKTVVAVEQGDYIRLWDLASGQSVSMFQNPEYGITTLALSPDGKVIAVGSRSAHLDKGLIVLWDAVRGWPIGPTLTANDYGVNAMAFSPDGKVLASANNNIMLWDVGTGASVGSISVTGQVVGLAYSPDGKTLATATYNGITLLDVQSGKAVPNLPVMADVGTGKLKDGLASFAISPDGKILASGGGGTIRLWDTNTGQMIGDTLKTQTRIIRCMAFSPDGKMLVSGADDMTILLWDLTQNPPVSRPLT